MIKVSVDLHNPGHYFACCGLLEVANQLWPGSTGWFASEEFHLEPGRRVDEPLGEVRRALCGQDAKLAPDAAAYDVGVRPLVLPQLKDFRLDWWLHWDDMKTWAGSQTPHGVFEKLRAGWVEMVQPVSVDVLRTTCVTTGRFGFDPAPAWDEIDLGFSPNDDDVQVETAPAVELLALIGLQRCQPLALAGGNLGYYAWRCPISSPIAAAGCAGAFGGSAYRFRITKRGKYGYSNWAIPVNEAAQQL